MAVLKALHELGLHVCCSGTQPAHVSKHVSTITACLSRLTCAQEVLPPSVQEPQDDGKTGESGLCATMMAPCSRFVEGGYIDALRAERVTSQPLPNLAFPTGYFLAVSKCTSVDKREPLTVCGLEQAHSDLVPACSSLKC